MTVETATKISQLNALFPPGSDPKSEGDNHLRLLKSVLQACFDDSTAGKMKFPGNTLDMAGITDGSNAAAGRVGEFVEATGATSTVTNATWVTIANTQLGLGAGDWEVWGSAFVNPAGGALTVVQIGIATAANAAPAQPALTYIGATSATIAQTIAATPRVRFNSAATINVFLNAYGAFSAGTCSAMGWIHARRMR